MKDLELFFRRFLTRTSLLRQLTVGIAAGLTSATVILIMLCFPVSADAQTSLVVDINKAQFQWNWTAGSPPNDGVADGFNIKCGQTSKTYTKITQIANPAARSAPIAPAIAGQGDWFCLVTAYNKVGESGGSNEISFFAGVAPSAPTNFMVVAQ